MAVAAATVNPVDVPSGAAGCTGRASSTNRSTPAWAGTSPAPFSRPARASTWPPGTRVAGLVGGLDRDFGTYAEQLVLPAADVAVVPDDLDLVEAATVPLNALTALQLVDILGDGEGRPCS